MVIPGHQLLEKAEHTWQQIISTSRPLISSDRVLDEAAFLTQNTNNKTPPADTRY
jgi:hypothetical protein